jgi:hypothetical protein
MTAVTATDGKYSHSTGTAAEVMAVLPNRKEAILWFYNNGSYYEAMYETGGTTG